MKPLILAVFTGATLLSIPVSAQKKIEQPNFQSTLDSIYRVEAQVYQRWASAQGDSARTIAERACASTIERDQYRIRDLTARYGFPTYTMVGQTTSQRFGELVLRYNRLPELQQRLQRLMAKEIKKDNVDDMMFAILTDVIELGAGRPQVYGTQLAYQGDNAGLVAREPLLEPAKVNIRRATLGLAPLEGFLDDQKAKHKPTTK
ncbi:DUF6624 domain-containing protein [Hymenobacter coccineus]|uniref:DUF4142 domain-containing protein n=1 Tax=Hymenobacter coccineus TaxID=1908235 RepID=A0A1G1TKT2_9BACT|nr:DUF6624 domain-containing protein [Hymenobacter coccineus]OGX91455.1 hypothetical protein BEN49_19650 [Hymenobacter coccineus]